MIMLWKLRQVNVAKQLYRSIPVLSGINSLLPNDKRRLHSAMQNVPGQGISLKSEKKFKLIDKLSNDYTLIYKSPLSTILTYSYHMSYLLVIIGLCGIYVIITQTHLTYPIMMPTDRSISESRIVEEPAYMGSESERDMLLLFVGLVLMNALIFFLIRMHALRIWFNPAENQYKLYFIGNLPGFKKSIVCSPGDAIRKRKNPLTAIGFVSHRINGKTYFFSESHFKTPSDYYKLVSNINT